MRKAPLSATTLAGSAATVAALALAPVGPAAATPVHSTDDFGFEVDDLCPFPVHLQVHDEARSTIATTASGHTEVVHVVETDTLSANGHTVKGLPYHWTARYEYAADGTLLGITAQGEVWRLQLPDGRIVSVGGRANWFTEQSVGSLKPDTFEPVCAALAP